MSASTKAQAEALEQAAEWYAILQNDTVTAKQQTQWQKWLLSDSLNQEAWKKIEYIDQQFSGVPAGSGLYALNAPDRSRRNILFGLTGLATLSVMSWRLIETQNLGEKLTTHIGKIFSTPLPDGGQIWLNTDTTILIDYQKNYRKITLVKGEVLIRTASDSRPFHVNTRFGSVSPVGTRFAIRQEENASYVAVTEGKVKISLSTTGVTELLNNGQLVRFSDTRILSRGSVSENTISWHQGVLVADNIALSDFLDQLARYRRGYLRYDQSISHLRVIGSFPLNDTDHILQALENTLPVKITSVTPWWVTVSAR